MLSGIPELVSMNYLMAAMIVVTTIGMNLVPGSDNPLTVEFWFIMSMALLVGFIAAYPINWWLVSNHLKHGMMTARPEADDETIANAQTHSSHDTQTSSHNSGSHPDKISNNMIWTMVIVSFIVFGCGVVFSLIYKA